MTVDQEDASSPNPVRLRVHELAEYLGMTASELMRRAQELGIDAHSALQSLSQYDVAYLVNELQSTGDRAPDEADVVIELPNDDSAHEAPRQSRSRLVQLLEDRWGIGLRARRLAVTAILMILGTVLLAVGYAYLRPAYSAEAQVVISSTGTDSSVVERELRSFEVIANSPTVLTPVAEEFGLTLPDLREMLSTEIQNDSRVIRLEVTDRDPATAESVAAAIVASFLAEAGRTDGGNLETYLDDRIASVTEAIEGLDTDLAELQAALSSIESERARLESQVDVATSKLVELESRLADVRSSADAPSGAASFLTGQIEETQAALDTLTSELEALITTRATPAEIEISRLEEERERLNEELNDLRASKLELEVDDVARPRIQVLSEARLSEEPAGLTPIKAGALGIVVGGILAALWIVATTQLRPEK